ncbi:hypothetical protein FJT64_016593 [Amphibalanus amphitrite]|uniref:Uncharacterized protein n=1 Tax=Amphibalanus amphitrite TaxID=1232801 RepID=A0A6A4X391_AMPAM|nr:hypothetical protein FJT64_016593 [Amphibalanus amphitrite]
MAGQVSEPVPSTQPITGPAQHAATPQLQDAAMQYVSSPRLLQVEHRAVRWAHRPKCLLLSLQTKFFNNILCNQGRLRARIKERTHLPGLTTFADNSDLHHL